MNESLQAKLAELSRRFAAQAPEQRAAVGDALERGDLTALGTLAHKLAGNAGMFGHAAIGEAALEVEESIDAGGDPREPTERLIALLDAL